MRPINVPVQAVLDEADLSMQFARAIENGYRIALEHAAEASWRRREDAARVVRGEVSVDDDREKLLWDAWHILCNGDSDRLPEWKASMDRLRPSDDGPAATEAAPRVIRSEDDLIDEVEPETVGYFLDLISRQADSSENPVQAAICTALGAASVSWQPMNGTGVFQPERATAIGEALEIVLRDLQAHQGMIDEGQR